MTTEIDRLWEQRATVPRVEMPHRMVEALRVTKGASASDVERLHRWAGHLSRRLQGQVPDAMPKDPLQAPYLLYLDGLGDTPWHETKDYAVTGVLEQNFKTIKEEMLDQTPDARRWQEYHVGVEAERKWRATWFYRAGVRQPDTAARYPMTSALFDEYSVPDGPMASTIGDCFFSRLEAGGHIPAHTGASNASLVCHLALVVPESCAFRVGSETRGWQEGRTLLFDESYEHEAWNKSGSDRYVLVLVLWQKGLTPVERDYMRVMRPWLDELLAASMAKKG